MTNMKRIHTVTIKHQPDEMYPDGEQTVTAFIGVIAKAEILLPVNESMSPKDRAATCSFITQHISSGGLWGIEG